MKIGLTETMLRGELWAGMDWVLQTAISVPSSTIKLYQTQKRISDVMIIDIFDFIAIS